MGIAINLLSYTIMLKLFQGLLGERRKNVRLFFRLYSVVAIICITIINGHGQPMINFISLFVYVVCTSMFFAGNIAVRTITILLYMGMGMIAEVLVMWISEYYSLSMQSKAAAYTAMIICEVIRYFFVFLICTIRKEKNEELPKGIPSVMAAVLLISLLGCVIVNMRMVEMGDNTYGAPLILLIFTAIHVLIFILFDRFRQITRMSHESEMVLQEAKLREDYYREVDENNIRMNKLKHDLKNRLAPLCELTERDIHEAEKTIREICQEIAQTGGRIYCRNRAVNSVCKVKLGEAHTKGIEVKYTIVLPDKINMAYGDIGILYGNLLDNAIEACERIETEEKFIRLNTELNKKSLAIYMENSKNPEEKVAPDGTVKKDKINHGIGLKSIKNIVEKYEGIIETKDKGDMFQVEILLYGIDNLDEKKYD